MPATVVQTFPELATGHSSNLWLSASATRSSLLEGALTPTALSNSVAEVPRIVAVASNHVARIVASPYNTICNDDTSQSIVHNGGAGGQIFNVELTPIAEGRAPPHATGRCDSKHEVNGAVACHAPGVLLPIRNSLTVFTRTRSRAQLDAMIVCVWHQHVSVLISIMIHGDV